MSSVAPSLPNLSYALVLMGIVSASLMVVGIFVFSTTLSGDPRIGLLTSTVSLGVLSTTGAFQSGEYPFMGALAFSFIALAVVLVSKGNDRLWLLPIASIAALLASLFDAYWGLILFFAVLGADLLHHRTWARPSRSLRSTAAMTPALVSSVLTLILLHQVPSVPFGVNFFLLVVLAAAAAWGGAALVLRSGRTTIAGVFPLVGASLVIGIFSPQYSVVPLSVLATLAVTNVGSKTIVAERSSRGSWAGNKHGDDVYNIEIDLMKLLSAIFVVLLLASSIFFGTLSFAQSLQQQRADVNTFGTSQASDALNWIRLNTTSGATIAAPQPFSDWVEAYAGRSTVFGRAVCPPSGQNSNQADTLDLLYNSNVELRNEYLKLRDGSPYSLAQTPMFSVSNGSSFADLIYTTDAYNRVGFSYAGSNWVEAPYQPKNFTSEWLARNSNEASIRMTYTTQSLIIQKTLSLSDGSSDAVIAYSVSPLRAVQLHSMNVTFWVPSGESVGNLNRSGGSIQLMLKGQPLMISSDPLPANASLALVGGQDRVLLQYAVTANAFSVSILMSFPSAEKSVWSQGVHGLTSDEIIKQHGVTYVAVLNQPYFVERFRSDSRFTQVYRNTNLLILNVKGSP